jgi:hypothetical protein
MIAPSAEGTVKTMTIDRDYWTRRAETELKRAETASDPAACKAHYELAGLYLNRVHGGEPPRRPRPRLSIVAG